MGMTGNRPAIIQSDRTILLEVDSPQYPTARDSLARFAELEKSPEYVHTYRITPLSLWNAAAADLDATTILTDLAALSKYPVPENVQRDIIEYVSRYGRVRLQRQNEDILLEVDDSALAAELLRSKRLQPYILDRVTPFRLRIDPSRRGHVKQALVLMGYPALDLAGYVPGSPLSLALRTTTRTGEPFQPRHYQTDAADSFYAQGTAYGGSGVIVLPCGAGKTIVGIAVMNYVQCATLILTTNTVAARQWIAELLDKTTLTEELIGEYSGLRKQVRPVTIATYQIMVHRSRQNGSGDSGAEYPHLSLFSDQDWGLVIYDEVHMLPAPVFRITAEIQARRRLGLTATLVREDGRETDVFSLIGPKKYDAPWKALERQGWIATAQCHEIRVALPDELRLSYALADDHDKYRIAAENPGKMRVLDQLLQKHSDDAVLIIGMYLDQLREVSARYGFPLVTGDTDVARREELYEAFRLGKVGCLVVSKVANFAIDLPDASVAMQLSGTFGSRQEEAQRLGRILRPKRQGAQAHFYTLVSRDTKDQDYAANRQRFLTEQGYHYDIIYEEEVAAWQPVKGEIHSPEMTGMDMVQL